MRIIINEDKMRLIESSEITFYEFKSNLQSLLKSLLSDPIKFELNEFWRKHGFSKKKLVEYLEKINIIESNKKIDGYNNYNVSYKALKKDFDSKCRKMFVKFFETNLPNKEDKEIDENVIIVNDFKLDRIKEKHNPNTIEEDGAPGGAGATSCGSAGVDGKNHIDVPFLGKPIKKIIYKPKK